MHGLLPLGPLRRHYRDRRPPVPQTVLRRLKVAAEDLLGQIMRLAGEVARRVDRTTVTPRHVQIAMEQLLSTVGGVGV